MSWPLMRNRLPALRTLPSRMYRTPSSRPTWRTSTALPLYVKLELRAITNSDLKRDSAVMMSSTIPSVKYSCSGSPLMFWKGRTAIEGLSGRASCSTDDGCLCSYEDSRDRDDGRRQSDGSHFTLKA